MSQPEARLQRRIQKALRQQTGGFWFKVWGGPFQLAGLPDLIGCVRGRFFGLEVKRPKKGRVSEIQWDTLGKIQDEGGCAQVVTSPDEAIEAVKSSLRSDPIAVLVDIANGHNRPRRLAQEFLEWHMK